MKPELLLKNLSFAVGLFAIISAILIGIGQKSLNVPLLVIACVTTSWVYTDWLRWIRLHRFLIYFLMIGGSVIAILDYLNQPANQQLYSVANLLVYAQLPLFFQEKSRRIFEQIGIFLLLELVVASLVNDDVVFGFLLVPTLALGAWVMVLYTSYATASRVGVESHGRKTWKEKLTKFLNPRVRGKTHRDLPVRIVPRQRFDRPRWGTVGLPLSFCLILFSGMYFYSIPRLSRGAYGSTGLGPTAIGFSDTVMLEQMGRILQSPTPVLRLELENMKDGNAYRPLEPPYIRGVALSEYRVERGTGTWQQSDYTPLMLKQGDRSIPAAPAEALIENERIRFSIAEQSYSGETAFSIPPCYRLGQAPELHFDPETWQLSSERLSLNGQTSRRTYQLLTHAFVNGVQSPWVPESETAFPDRSFDGNRTAAAPPYEELSLEQHRSLTKWSASRFGGLTRYRDRILNPISNKEISVVDKALLLRDDLANSPEFSYTLDLTLKRDRLLDPIEDFVTNQKKGHCQFFASALVIMLRSMNVPARLVVGYRPADYNEVGKYFLVRQSHAHAWVEAYFTREQCESSTLVKLPDAYKKGGWYRLDPTPPGNGSNSGRTLSQPNSQTLDFAQQLWRDYIMNIDRSNQPNAVERINALSSSIYGKYLKNSKEALDHIYAWLQQQLVSKETWMSWRGILMLGGLAIAGLLTWRFAPSLLRTAWKSNRSKALVRNLDPQQEFYRRLLQILSRAGYARAPYQTHQEFLKEVLRKDPSLQAGDASRLLDDLTQLYYSMRYGHKNSVDSEENRRIESSLERIEQILGPSQSAAPQPS